MPEPAESDDSSRRDKGGHGRGPRRSGTSGDSRRAASEHPRTYQRSAPDRGITRPAHAADPVVDDDVTGWELDRDVRGELRGLSKDYAQTVTRHLVMVARLLESEPERALAHALAAQRRAGRLGVVREAAGLAYYRTGRYAEALAELRTARRLTGSSEHLGVMADCERGLGRPERALALLTSPEAASLDEGQRVELLVVASGARRDLGQPEAAVVMLQVPELHISGRRPWHVRLYYAYADALLSAGRSQEARSWFARAVEADEDGETDAAERLDDIDGLVFGDALDPELATDERQQ